MEKEIEELEKELRELEGDEGIEDLMSFYEFQKWIEILKKYFSDEDT